MSASSKIEFLVLWEDELRTAARLIALYDDLPGDASDAAVGDALCAAISACRVALAGLDDSKVVGMMCHRDFIPIAGVGLTEET